jgi:hypothetical protein
MQSIKLVILESPFAGDVEANLAYARRAAKDCSTRNESVAASHLLFTQFLDDNVPAEREMGIALGLAWQRVADYSVFYTDRGWSRGMLHALESALEERRPYLVRALDGPVKLPDPTVDPVYRRFSKARS